MNKFIFIIIVALGLQSQAARVAVTDSGTDFQHQWLKGRELINAREIPGNMVDDDLNGKVDDIMGWNFAENYGEVFFRDHLSSIKEKTFKIFEVLARVQAGSQSPEDEKFWKEEVQGLPDSEKQKLMAEVNFYGQYAHGTHVSGIVAQVASQSRIMSLRVFPDQAPSGFSTMNNQDLPVVTYGILDYIYKFLGTVTNGTFHNAASYLKEQKVDVANYSLGVSLQMIARAILGMKGVKDPTPAQLAKETQRIYAQYEPQGRKWIEASSETLFVMASGNDGTDNDAMPAFPANVRAKNSITVAATAGFQSLAKFSNTGHKTVDIAAPGVAIQSSVPSLSNKQTLPMSGTSMAAPYIAGVAAQIKDSNPQLTAVQIKQILMGTVDQKDWLKGKVISSGVVNPKRAYMAAERSKSMPVEQAIQQARSAVEDTEVMHYPLRVKSQSQDAAVVKEMQEAANQLVF